MASLRKAKKQAKKEGRIFIDPTKEKKQLLRDVNQLIKQTNKSLRQLDRKVLKEMSSKIFFLRLKKINLKIFWENTFINRYKKL